MQARQARARRVPVHWHFTLATTVRSVGKLTRPRAPYYSRAWGLMYRAELRVRVGSGRDALHAGGEGGVVFARGRLLNLAEAGVGRFVRGH